MMDLAEGGTREGGTEEGAKKRKTIAKQTVCFVRKLNFFRKVASRKKEYNGNPGNKLNLIMTGSESPLETNK